MVYFVMTADQRARAGYYPAPPGDGCRELDIAMGGRSRQPMSLLSVVIGDEVLPQSPDDRHDLRHQALLRLLATQLQSVPRPPTPGTGIDHTYVHLLDRSDTKVRVLATPSLLPDRFDEQPWEGYWDMEVLEFSPAGHLLTRHAHHEK